MSRDHQTKENRHIIFKGKVTLYPKTMTHHIQRQRKILKTAKEKKGTLYVQKIKDKNYSKSKQDTVRIRITSFKCWKKKRQSTILYSAKMFHKNKEKIKSFRKTNMR